MAPVTIYTTRFCPYCSEAKSLLRRKEVPFEEIDVSGDRTGRAAMTERARGRPSVPQIFIGERHVGGCDDLLALDQAGQRDTLLAA